MKAEISERLSNQPLAQKKQKPMWLEVAIGVYMGGAALLATMAIISAATMSLVIASQEKLLSNELKQADKVFKSLIPQPSKAVQHVDMAQNYSWHKVIDRCIGFKNRAETLQENLRIPRLIDNYSSAEQMNDELNSLLETIKKDCQKQ